MPRAFMPSLLHEHCILRHLLDGDLVEAHDQQQESADCAYQASPPDAALLKQVSIVPTNGLRYNFCPHPSLGNMQQLSCSLDLSLLTLICIHSFY